MRPLKFVLLKAMTLERETGLDISFILLVAKNIEAGLYNACRMIALVHDRQTIHKQLSLSIFQYSNTHNSAKPFTSWLTFSRSIHSTCRRLSPPPPPSRSLPGLRQGPRSPSVKADPPLGSSFGTPAESWRAATALALHI